MRSAQPWSPFIQFFDGSGYQDTIFKLLQLAHFSGEVQNHIAELAKVLLN
ncbi:hypothetical protein N9954_06790 [Maribacter sp.]|nr:hypothetical protein [Maribacter sp.]